MIECLQLPVTMKARSKHFCDECNGPIAPGEEYVKATYKYDGVYSWKQHAKCAEFQKKHGETFAEDDGACSPIWDWEDGYLSDEIWKERTEILEKAGWKTKDRANTKTP